MVFSSLTSSMSVNMLSNYRIKSDENISPFSEYNIQQGYFVDRTLPIYSVRNNGDYFFRGFIFATEDNIEFERVYGKVD